MYYIINGGKPLCGEIADYGAKNCALALLGASVLTDEKVVLHNCPEIDDVSNMLKLLQALGKRVVRDGADLSVSGTLNSTCAPSQIATLLRGSALILGGTVARFGQIALPLPGGCAIGARPMDIHLDGLRAMGVQVRHVDNMLSCRGFPQGARFRLRFASVGATENLLCACTLAKGTSVLENCATEPEVVALEEFLSLMGAEIEGKGTSRLTVRGVDKLHGAEFSVIPDRIVAATYLAGAVATLGEICVTNCVPEHLEAFLQLLRPFADIKLSADGIWLKTKRQPQGFGVVETAPYPLFPTDMQSLLLSLAAISCGETVIKERLFENRLAHNARQLSAMGANVCVEGNVARVFGGKLHGADVVGADLRGGAGLVIATLAAQGTSRVYGIEHINRGYVDLSGCFGALGADIAAKE